MLLLAADRIGLAIERMRLQESEQAARRAAETANRQKSSFPATASHDLRQPLQTLGLLNGTLRRLFPEPEMVADLISMEDALNQVAGDCDIDLLVTDFHLEDGQTGTDVIIAVRKALQRQTKAILITGNTSSAIAELSRDPSIRVVSKPVAAEHLLSLIRALLALG